MNELFNVKGKQKRKKEKWKNKKNIYIKKTERNTTWQDSVQGDEFARFENVNLIFTMGRRPLPSPLRLDDSIISPVLIPDCLNCSRINHCLPLTFVHLDSSLLSMRVQPEYLPILKVSKRALLKSITTDSSTAWTRQNNGA